MTARAALLLRLGFTVAWCAGGVGSTAAHPTESPLEPVPSTSARAASASNAEPESPTRENAWIDPEPDGAQELAERVVGAPFNEDKTRGLRMRISRLVDRRTGLVGFASGIGAVDTSLADRLARLGAEETDLEIRIRLPGSILFDFNSDAIRADAERTLAELVGVLEAYGAHPVRIEGHTDAIASDDYNQRLSERRAGAVRDWLEEHQISPGRLTTVGHGESQPAATNDTAAGRQLNRRVEVVVEKGAPE